MYYTEMDPITGRPLFVEKNIARKEEQKDVLTAKLDRPRSARLIGVAPPRRPARKKTGRSGPSRS
jgi:hypothetical protein